MNDDQQTKNEDGDTSTIASDDDVTTTTTTTQKYKKPKTDNNSIVAEHLQILYNCTDDEEILRLACQNIRNHKDIDAVEWSERILIQCCAMNELDFEDASINNWKTISTLVSQYQWVVVAGLIKQYINNQATLQKLLCDNRCWKIQNGFLPTNSQKAFHTKSIGIKASLCNYVPEAKVHTLKNHVQI